MNPKSIPLTPALLLDALKTGRRLGTITPSKPISGARLVRALLSRWNVKTSAREIRDAMNTLCDAGEYVCSCNRGYYYALTFDEMTVAIDFYTSYIGEYTRRRAAMVKARERLREPEQDMFGHPVVDGMRKQFQGVEI